ncbi:MAG: PKD domain containing protein, partial [Candidatus Latescibacteria bacterium]|nr:PKD domain containing protein [Candidatus Latescibacterota bacterium]
MAYRIIVTVLVFISMVFSNAEALERPDMEFKIFQFPTNMIPRIDGKTDDWDVVQGEYIIGS